MGTIFYLLFLSLTLLFIFSIRTAIHENTKHGTLERRHPRGRNVLWCIRCHFPLLSAYLEYLLSDFPHDVPSVFFFSSVLCVRKSIGFESNNLWLASQLIHLKAMLRWDKLLHWASTSLSDISETPLPYLQNLNRSPIQRTLRNVKWDSVKQEPNTYHNYLIPSPVPPALCKEGPGKKILT